MHFLYTMQSLILSKSDHTRQVGIRMRQLIAAMGLKQVQAAADMGITKNHLGNWLRGESYVGLYELYRFCRLRGVNTDWVFLGDPSGLPVRVAQPLLAALALPEDHEEKDTQGFDSPDAGSVISHA